jgi:hypothetical protein
MNKKQYHKIIQTIPKEQADRVRFPKTHVGHWNEDRSRTAASVRFLKHTLLSLHLKANYLCVYR